MAGGTIRVGQLRQRIIVQVLAEVLGSLGEPTDSWSTEATVWANVLPRSGREDENMRQMGPDISHTVTIRHRDMSTERRFLVRKATTQLNGAINDSVTTVVVDTDLAISPSTQFRIQIDSEIMIVTAGAGTTSWTVTRGDDGTTAASHLDNAIVTHLAILNIQDRVNVDEFDKQLVLGCVERP